MNTTYEFDLIFILHEDACALCIAYCTHCNENSIMWQTYFTMCSRNEILIVMVNIYKYIIFDYMPFGCSLMHALKMESHYAKIHHRSTH